VFLLVLLLLLLLMSSLPLLLLVPVLHQSRTPNSTSHTHACDLVLSCRSERLTVGITSESMLTNKVLAELIPDLHTRKACVVDFLGTIAPHLSVDVRANKRRPSLAISVLEDPVGPAGTDPFCAIVATDETFPAVEMINTQRAGHGKSRMAAEAIPLVNMGDVIDAPEMWPWRFLLSNAHTNAQANEPNLKGIFKDDKVCVGGGRGDCVGFFTSNFHETYR
jgi:phosphopantetheine adenylyltransferase